MIYFVGCIEDVVGSIWKIDKLCGTYCVTFKGQEEEEEEEEELCKTFCVFQMITSSS